MELPVGYVSTVGRSTAVPNTALSVENMSPANISFRCSALAAVEDRCPMKLLIAAILWLAPGVEVNRAKYYASLILDAGGCYKIDPLLIVTKIHLETGGTWRETVVSATNDYGLAQVHVSKTTNKEYMGLEHLLLEPGRNIWVAVRMMSYWKGYHKRNCLRQGHASHPWWGHYKWGNKVGNLGSSMRVKQLYGKLKTRFRYREIFTGFYKSPPVL